jgi:transposase
MRSRIEPMKQIARSLRQHRELILDYFRAQKLLPSGAVEGLNNKAKVTMRKSHGFRTFRVTRAFRGYDVIARASFRSNGRAMGDRL